MCHRCVNSIMAWNKLGIRGLVINFISHNLQDVDEFFEHQKTFLVEYHTRIKGATERADRMTKTHKSK